MDRSGADQQLVRKPPSSGVTDGAGWQGNVSGLPPTRSTLSPPLTGLTHGLQVIEGLHHAGVEFHSPSEDFDTSTSTGKLQLAVVVAFSAWWRNSIRERSVVGQAKARAEGLVYAASDELAVGQRYRGESALVGTGITGYNFGNITW